MNAEMEEEGDPDLQVSDVYRRAQKPSVQRWGMGIIHKQVPEAPQPQRGSGPPRKTREPNHNMNFERKEPHLKDDNHTYKKRKPTDTGHEA